LRDHDDLTRFSVRVVEGCSPELIARCLEATGAGRLLDSEQVAINVEWLSQHTASKSTQWHSDFQQMLDYAASKGWTDPLRTVVIAHVEPSTTPLDQHESS